MVRPIHENYKDYRPSGYVRSTIAELLSTLPERYLSGLQSVVLTNASAVGKGKTGRIQGRKHLRQRCLGFYHPERKGQPAWIEIVVDNIIAARVVADGVPSMPRLLMHIPVVRNLVFADTVFHEVGHHLDATIGAPARSGEAAAEAWNRRLIGPYFRKHYWYLMPLVRIAYAFVSAMARRRGAAEKAPRPGKMSSRPR